MDPMARVTARAGGSFAAARSGYAGQMPNPPTPTSAICGLFLSVSPGDYVVRWDDDGSLVAITAADFDRDFEIIL
jgi:hypothetical protein